MAHAPGAFPSQVATPRTHRRNHGGNGVRLRVSRRASPQMGALCHAGTEYPVAERVEFGVPATRLTRISYRRARSEGRERHGFDIGSIATIRCLVLNHACLRNSLPVFLCGLCGEKFRLQAPVSSGVTSKTVVLQIAVQESAALSRADLPAAQPPPTVFTVRGGARRTRRSPYRRMTHGYYL